MVLYFDSKEKAFEKLRTLIKENNKINMHWTYAYGTYDRKFTFSKDDSRNPENGQLCKSFLEEFICRLFATI